MNDLRQFVAWLAKSNELWAPLVRHDSAARVYEQIWDDEHVNAWLICWSEDQDTGFHDHDVSAAAVAVIAGCVREDRLTFGRAQPHSREFAGGELFTLPPVAIHRVLHTGDEPAVTLHAYSPPLRRTGAYHVGPDGELQRESLPVEQELRPEPVLL